MTTPQGGTSISCPCGASLEIDPNETTQEISCPECGMILEIAVAIDSRSKKVKLGILVKSQSVTHRQAKGKGEEVHTAKCVCGAQITIETASMTPDSVFTCEACEADYTAVLKKSKSGGTNTLVLRPLVAAQVTKTSKPAPAKAPPAPPPLKTLSKSPPIRPPLKTTGPTRPAAAPAKPAALPGRAPVAPAPPSAATALAAKERLIQMSKADVGAQDFAGGHILCFCRAPIDLKDGFPKEIVKCPECGTGFRIFQATNPKNGEQMAVMIPRS